MSANAPRAAQKPRQRPAVAQTLFRQIVVNDAPIRQRQVSDHVHSADDLSYRQIGKRAVHYRHQLQSRPSGPGACDLDVLEFDRNQLGYGRLAINVEDQLQRHLGVRQQLAFAREIRTEGVMLVDHRPGATC